MNQFLLFVPLDFEVYERGKWDDNDMVINGWNIDIKSVSEAKEEGISADELLELIKKFY